MRSCRYFMIIFRNWAPEAVFALSESVLQMDHCYISAFIYYSWWIPMDRLYLQSNFCLRKLSVLVWNSTTAGSFVLSEFKRAPEYYPLAPSLSLLFQMIPQSYLDFGLNSWACICWGAWGWGSFCSPSRWKKLRLEGVEKWNLKVVTFKFPNQLGYLSL